MTKSRLLLRHDVTMQVHHRGVFGWSVGCSVVVIPARLRREKERKRFCFLRICCLFFVFLYLAFFLGFFLVFDFSLLCCLFDIVVRNLCSFFMRMSWSDIDLEHAIILLQ